MADVLLLLKYEEVFYDAITDFLMAGALEVFQELLQAVGVVTQSLRLLSTVR